MTNMYFESTNLRILNFFVYIYKSLNLKREEAAWLEKFRWFFLEDLKTSKGHFKIN